MYIVKHPGQQRKIASNTLLEDRLILSVKVTSPLSTSCICSERRRLLLPVYRPVS